MADEVSNKTLAILVVAAIVVTLGGTMLVLRSGPSAQLTGMVETQTGTASINVSEVIDIELDDATSNFGTGYVNDTSVDKACTMNTEGVSDSLDCMGDWANVEDDMHIVNEGNVNIVLTVETGEPAATFITGTDAEYGVKSTEDESGSCAGNLSNGYESLNNVVTLCDDFEYGSTADELFIDYEVTVPSDANPGVRTSTLTFSASKA